MRARYGAGRLSGMAGTHAIEHLVQDLHAGQRLISIPCLVCIPCSTCSADMHASSQALDLADAPEHLWYGVFLNFSQAQCLLSIKGSQRYPNAAERYGCRQCF